MGGRDGADDERATLLPLAAPPRAGCIRPSTWFLVDLVTLSFGVTLTFIAYNGCQQIITTLLPKIGALSLGICYTTFAVACTVAPAVVHVIGLKPAICIQLLFLSLWIGSNMWPSVELAAPVALVMGFFASSFWTAVPTYIATICGKYDRARQLESGHSSVKGKGAGAGVANDDFDDDAKPSLPTISPANGTAAPPSMASRLAGTLRLVATDDRLGLMVPLFCYQGFEQAFFFSVFGSKLVAPTFGDGMVGTISVGFGVSNVIASPLLGRLTDTVGWTAPLAIGILVQIAALVMLVAWHCFGLIAIEHNDAGVALMYGVAGAWGVGDAAFNSVVSAMLGKFFPPGGDDNSKARGGVAATEGAFANMRLWSSLLTGVIFFGMPVLDRRCSRRTALTVELVAPLAMAVVACVGLCVLRYRHGSLAATRDPSGGANRQNTLGMFQGVFFCFFMSSHIIGNSLTGAVLGDATAKPPHHRVVRLFAIFSSLGLAGFATVTLFLRRHAPTPPVAAPPAQNGSTADKKAATSVN